MKRNKHGTISRRQQIHMAMKTYVSLQLRYLRVAEMLSTVSQLIPPYQDTVKSKTNEQNK
jgi:hypothetical protein